MEGLIFTAMVQGFVVGALIWLLTYVTNRVYLSFKSLTS